MVWGLHFLHGVLSLSLGRLFLLLASKVAASINECIFLIFWLEPGLGPSIP